MLLNVLELFTRFEPKCILNALIILGDLEHHLMGMGLGGAALAGGAVVGARRNPDIPPVQLQPNLPGFAAWREWENGRQRVEEQLQAPNQPPLLDGNARAPRSGSQEAAENAAFWQRNAVRISR